MALTADGRAVLTGRDGLHEAMEVRFVWRKYQRMVSISSTTDLRKRADNSTLYAPPLTLGATAHRPGYSEVSCSIH